jgi:hypothetical protein
LICKSIEHVVNELPHFVYFEDFAKELVKLKLVNSKYRQCIRRLYPPWKMSMLRSCALNGVSYLKLMDGSLVLKQHEAFLGPFSLSVCFRAVAYAISVGFHLDYISTPSYLLLTPAMRSIIRERQIDVNVLSISNMHELELIQRDVARFRFPEWQMSLLRSCTRVKFPLQALLDHRLQYVQHDISAEVMAECYEKIHTAHIEHGFQITAIKNLSPLEFLVGLPNFIQDMRPKAIISHLDDLHIGAQDFEAFADKVSTIEAGRFN